MFPDVNTKSPTAVQAAVETVLRTLFPTASCSLVARLFAEVTAMFSGRYLDYQPIDLGYHDYEHTLQAALCYARIFAGRQAARAEPPLTARQFEIGLAAVLLHDTGYLKLRSDVDGTSAKYTHVHVLRSAAFAASYVPSIGFNVAEAEVIAAAINCTGPAHRFIHLQFSHLEDKLIGSMLVTADYLGQMAAPDYPDELEVLYREFEESDDFFHQAHDARSFRSAQDLIRHTRTFWSQFVRPKLEEEFDGMYRFLARPYPDGPNPYVQAIENNLRRIEARG